MDLALAASALAMGLAGGPHCATMCGAAFGAIARPAAPARSAWRAMAALQLGRLAGYAAAGALVSASVSWLTALGGAAPVLRPLWTLLHVAAVALGLSLLWRGRAPAWLASLGQRRVASPTQPVRFVARLPKSARVAGIGVCWAAMPCGLLQSALIIAALASGPWQGAGVMAAFATSSALALWAAPVLWLRLQRGGGVLASNTLSVRLAGGLLVVASGYALVHGLRAAIEQALCLT
jgi:sulfite exporter TauE/SafE